MAHKRTSTTRTIWPITVAAGVAALLIGLVVSPEVIAPLGAAIALLGVVGWVRRDTAPAANPPPEPARDESPADRFPRSRFLERATIGLGGLVAAAVALPVAGLALLPSLVGARRRAVDLGPLSAFPEGRFVITTFLADPQAGEVSRRSAYIRNNGSLAGVPSFTVMSSRCTHVGCPTQPNGQTFTQQRRTEHTASGEVGVVPTFPAGGFGCPCHGSQFDTEGNRTAGPAARALDRYAFSIRNGRLWLNGLFSASHVDGVGANARIHAFARRGAGEPASGPESWLYPIDPLNSKGA
jgi:Rieske Fe-S protein